MEKKDKTWTAEAPKYKFIEVNKNLVVTYPVNNGHQSELNEVAQSMIAELLPDDLRSFFFIDGEQLHEFFRKDASRNLKNAIEKLSQLDVVDAALFSLKKYREDLRKKVRATHPDLSGVQEKLSNSEQMIERLKNAKKNLVEKNAALSRQKEEIDLFLKNYNVQDINYLSQEIRKAEKELESEKVRLAKVEQRKKEYMLYVAPSIFMKDTLKEAYAVIDTLIEHGTLPPMIRESFIHELLQEGVCVCGTPLSPESRKILKEYADKIQISEMDSIAQEGKGEFLNHFDNIRKFPTKIDNYNDQISDCEERIDRYVEDIQNKKYALRNYNIEEINAKSSERDKIMTEIGANTSKISQADIQLRSKNDDLRKLQREMETEREKFQINSEHLNRLDAVKETLDILERVEERVKSQIRKSLEENTKKYFFEFIREKVFRDVTISDSYEVSVTNKEGWENLGDLSAGQYLVLGYAFVVALRTITGYQAPVIVDTPLGKLDQIHQNNITRYLPPSLDGAQLVFLVTSSEYTPTVKENFSKFMGDDSYYEIHRYSDITSARLVHHGL